MLLLRYFSVFLYFVHVTLSAEPVIWTLENAEKQALTYNEQLLSLENRVEAARQRRLQAISSYLPSVGATGRYAKTKNSSILTPSENTSVTVAFTQNIFVGDVYYANQSARLDYQSLSQQLQDLKSILLFQVKQAYFSVLLAEEGLNVQKENVDLLTEALKREMQMLDLGESKIFDVNQSKVSVANALSAYYVAVKEEQASYNVLRRLLGLNPSEGRVLISERVFPIHEIPILNKNLEKLGMKDEGASVIDRLLVEGHLSDEKIFSDIEIRSWETRALSKRPDIQIQETILDQARYDVSSYKAKYFPDFTAFANYDWTSPTSSLTNDKDNWRMGFSMSWNLFDSFARERKVNEAKMLERSAKHSFQDVINAAKADVRDRIYDVEEGLMSYFAAYEGANLAKAAIKEAKQRRELGVITALEYRDTASEFTKANHNFNLAAYRLLIAYHALKTSVGDF